MGRQLQRLAPVRQEEVAQDTTGLVAHPHHAIVAVQVREEEVLQLLHQARHVRRIADQTPARPAHVLDGRDLCIADVLQARHHEIVRAAADDPPHRLVAHEALAADALGHDLLVRLAKEGDGADLLHRDHPRGEAVVDVVVVVGDLVHEVDELRLQRGRFALRVLRGCAGVAVRLVLDDPLPDLPGEVQPRELRVALLEHFQDAQGLPVVLEAPVIGHQLGHDLLAGMAERRVPEVVAEHQALREVLVEGEAAGHAAPDLRTLQAVGEAGAVVVALVVDEHLRLVLQPAERGAVDDAVPVALVAGAVGVVRLQVPPPAALGAAHAVGSEEPVLPLLQRLAVDQLHDTPPAAILRPPALRMTTWASWQWACAARRARSDSASCSSWPITPGSKGWSWRRRTVRQASRTARRVRGASERRCRSRRRRAWSRRATRNSSPGSCSPVSIPRWRERSRRTSPHAATPWCRTRATIAWTRTCPS